MASVTREADIRRAGFLSDYARLQPVPGAGGAYCWRDTSVSLRPYTKVAIARVQVALADTARPVDPADLKMLTDSFHADLVKAIGRDVQVVGTPGPGVLVLRIALTELVPTNQLLSVAGTAAPYGFVADIGAGAATGGPAGSTPYLGRTGMQLQFRDAASHKVIGECADTQIGLKYAADLDAGAAGAAEAWLNGYVDSFTQWNYAKAAFDKWANEIARKLGELRAS